MEFMGRMERYKVGAHAHLRTSHMRTSRMRTCALARTRTCAQESLCVPYLYGCTNIRAVNFNSSSNSDDGPSNCVLVSAAARS